MHSAYDVILVYKFQTNTVKFIYDESALFLRLETYVDVLKFNAFNFFNNIHSKNLLKFKQSNNGRYLKMLVYMLHKIRRLQFKHSRGNCRFGLPNNLLNGLGL